MYKKNIRIRTCGDDDALLEHLRQVPLPAYCNVTFCKEKDLGICDFCFVKFQEKENVAKACKNIFNESVIFLLEEGDHVAKDCWEHCFDCWHLDGDFEEICHRYAALLQRLELKHERDLEHKYLETIIDNSDALIWIKDNKGKHLEVNQSFCNACGKKRNDVRGRGHFYIWDLDYSEYEKGEYVCVETDEIVMNEGRAGIFDETVKTRQGMRRFRTAKAPIYDDDGKVAGTVGIASDVTDVLNLGTEIQTVIDQMPFGVVIYDDRGYIRNCNQRFRTLAGGLLEPSLDLTVSDVQRKLLDEGGSEKELDNGQFELYGKYDDHQVWYVVSKSDLKDVFGKKLGNLLTFEDVTVERLRSQTFEMQAMTDVLTGIGNRRYFFFMVHQMRGTNRSDGVIFLDLNKFKMLNDSYGHEAGDEALVEIAEIMKRIFPGNDAVLARYGGDEFVIYLKDPEEGRLQTLALQLATEIKNSFENNPMKGLTASVGSVYNKADGHHLDALINAADSCMNEAKKRGVPVYHLSLSA